jgi:5-formyltetrahydrofolate cyclo-ligase
VNPSEDIPGDKPALRAWAKGRRAGMNWDALSRTLTGRLRALPEMAAARDVLLYLAMPGEVRVEDLAEGEDASTRRWYAPRCAPGRRLAVHPYAPGTTPLRPGPFGIREPDPALAPEQDPSALDLVIVPALLLSESGDRIGHAGGYYDRFLPRLSPTCTRVGVLPDALVLPDLPRDPWDQRVDLVVTETRVLRPGRTIAG